MTNLIKEVITKREVVEAAGGKNYMAAKIFECAVSYVSRWPDDNVPEKIRLKLGAGTTQQRGLWRTIQRMRRESE